MNRAQSFFHPYPKYLQIADLLRHRVLTQLKPGDRFPPEVAIAEEFGVSRETVRQALDILEKDGLISRARRRGSFVTERPPYHPLEKLTGMVENFQALGLETYAKRLQQDVIKADEEVALYLKVKKDTPIVRIDRLRYLDKIPLAYHVAFLPADVGATLLQETKEPASIVHVLEKKLRFAFEEDQQIIEADKADVKLAEHLDVPIGAPILLLRRIYITKGERPIAYFKSYFRADRYMYTVKLRQTNLYNRRRAENGRRVRAFGGRAATRPSK